MAAFTLTGLSVCVALAFVTSVVVPAAFNILVITRFASIKGANISAPSLPGPSGVSTQQNDLIAAANSITFIVTAPAEPASTANTCNNNTFNRLMVPQIDTTDSRVRQPSTPVLGGQYGVAPIPPLNLDAVHRASTLITSSPYAQNEGLTFSTGTSFWQPYAGAPSASTTATRGSPAIITESSFAQNEGLTFPPGTSLWQPSSSTPTITRPQASPPSLWTPANASFLQTKSSAPQSMRSMGAPLPVSNLITQSPFASNEGLKIPTGTPMWQPGSAAGFKPSSAKPSLVTSSPYAFNETVTFPKGTRLWQPKTDEVPPRFPWSCLRSFVSGVKGACQKLKDVAKASWCVLRGLLRL